MSSRPKISIVLPSYNRAEYLSKAIESCLAQTMSDFELIIVDDCSTDQSLSRAYEYAARDKRITVVKNEINKKLPATLNVGFERALGEYFTWISDDNLYHPQALEKMSLCLDRMPEIGLIYTDYTVINKSGWWGYRLYQESPEFLPIRNCVGACFLYRAVLAKQVGQYDEKMFLVEDYDYWLRLGLVTQFFHLKESLYFYRSHAKSLTHNHKKALRKAKNLLKKIYMPQYNIPKKYQSIHELYMWFIGDRTFLTYGKLFSIILRNPMLTVSYIIRNLLRLHISR